MKKNIIAKLLNLIEKEVIPPIKKDLKWFGKALNKDLKKLIKEKKVKKKINL